jgi:hypothetical protein
MKVQMVKSEKVMKFFGDKYFINVFFQRGGNSLFLPASGRDKNSAPNSGFIIRLYCMICSSCGNAFIVTYIFNSILKSFLLATTWPGRYKFTFFSLLVREYNETKQGKLKEIPILHYFVNRCYVVVKALGNLYALNNICFSILLFC